MNNDATIYTVYLGYKGRKCSLMDTASALKASTIMLQDDEIVYTMVTLGKLYAFAGYLPESTDIKEKSVTLTNGINIVVLDIDNIQSAKDRSMAILTAMSYQTKYDACADRIRGVMDDLDELYKKGKDFDTLVNVALRAEDLSISALSKLKDSIIDFLKFFKDNIEYYDKNIIHLAYSEVVEDIDEIKHKKKLK